MSRAYLKICALLFLSLLLLTSGKKPVSRDSDVSSDSVYSLVGYTFSEFRVSLALCSTQSRQYVAYYDTLKQMTIAQRNLPDGPWKEVKLDSWIGWDSHNSIVMISDSAGRIHISGNMHVSPLNYFMTDETGDISTLRRLDSLIGSQESRTTYPAFLPLPDGRLIFHYRNGSSGAGEEIYNVCSPEGEWSRYIDTPLADGLGRMNAYMTEPQLGPDKMYHMIWVWRNSSDCSTNHDLSYAKSPDLIHWYNVFGEPLRLPITIDQEGMIVDPVKVGGGLLNGTPRLSFDANRRPMITYFKYDQNGNTQIYLARFEDGDWHIACLTDWDFRWDLVGGGSLKRELWTYAAKPDGPQDILVPFKRVDSKGAIEPKEIIVDAETLEPVSIRKEKPVLPKWFFEIDHPYTSDMMVNYTGDRGRTDYGGYMLRWESRPANRDQKVDEKTPPVDVRVVKIR